MSAAPAGSSVAHAVPAVSHQAAEVALRDSKGHVLAVIFRNMDGAYGSHHLKAAAIDERRLMSDPDTPKMASAGRTSSVTTGSGQSNDVYRFMYHRAAPAPYTAPSRAGT